jgi:hypothetical protein
LDDRRATDVRCSDGTAMGRIQLWLGCFTFFDVCTPGANVGVDGGETISSAGRSRRGGDGRAARWWRSRGVTDGACSTFRLVVRHHQRNVAPRQGGLAAWLAAGSSQIECEARRICIWTRAPHMAWPHRRQNFAVATFACMPHSEQKGRPSPPSTTSCCVSPSMDCCGLTSTA